MEKNIEFLGIIPARGGSKGISKKNIKPIAGKPLIAWTIEKALQSTHLTKLIVSTDNYTIAKVSKAYGAEVLMRPPELATDDSLVIHTLQHAIKHFPANAIVILQPTSPIRSKRLIDFCIESYIYNDDVDAVVTGFDCHFKPYDTYIGRRQDLDTFFYNDGNIYIINTKLIKDGQLNTSNYYPIRTSKRENVEIDDDFDFWLAEKILEEQNV